MKHRLGAILERQDEVLAAHYPLKRAGSYAEVLRLYTKAAGKCDICGRMKGKRNHALDHDHKTGKFRGVLCAACNMGLGMFKDDTRILALAIDYLEKHDKK